MNATEHEIVVKRILVAVDASAHSEAALDAAAHLAARLSAELEGLFVEDVNLLRLAELPFAREVGFYTAAGRRLDARTLERQLRAQARRVRQRLTIIADREQLRWSFRIARGTITSELLAASSSVDMVILGKSGWSLQNRRGLGSTARALVSAVPAMTLILSSDTFLGLPIVAVYDGSPAAQRALAAAAVLARSEESPVTVVLVGDGAETRELRAQASAQMERSRVEVGYRVLSESSVSTLAHNLRSEGCGTLVLPAKIALLEDDAVHTLLDRVDVPTLFVR